MGKQQNQNSKKNYRIFPFQQGVRTLRSLIFAFERQVFVKQKAESTAGKKKSELKATLLQAQQALC